MPDLLNFQFDEEVSFPHPLSSGFSDAPLAYGGTLSKQRLVMSYAYGIFPWYNEVPILWWYTQPRFVLFPQDIKISKSMRQVLRREPWKVTFNTAFSDVIRMCGATKRENQEGTWINVDMIRAYEALHVDGWAHSVEVWSGEKLVGGLYGVLIGRIFYGESMFTHVSNASKAALIIMTKKMKARGLELIDCQQETPHLKSMGGKSLDGTVFYDKLFANRRANESCMFPVESVKLPFLV